MIIDEVQIVVKGGSGGNGAVSFRREKFIPRGGPDGGNGGDGGDVWFRGTSDLTALMFFRGKKEIKAASGEPGLSKKRHGKNGKDLEVRIPIGTTITNLDNGQVIQISEADQTVLVAKGGRGGKGNFELRSPPNRTPKE